MNHPPQDVFAAFRRYRRYVDFTEDDERRLHAVWPLVEPYLGELIDDFYQAMRQEPVAMATITGGDEQIERLKQSLRDWLEKCFQGPYDEQYVRVRWRVGWRHADVGLPETYALCAMARLRAGLAAVISRRWSGDGDQWLATLTSLGKLLDLDIAMISEAYHREFASRQRDEAVRRGQAEFRHLTDADDSMIVVLRPNGAIAYLNPFGRRLTGVSADEAEGADIRAIRAFDQRDADELAETLERAARDHVECRWEGRLRDARGESRNMLWMCRPIDEFHGASGVVLAGQDVTEQRRAEQRALQAQRLAAVGEMIAGLAHESRNAFQRSQASLDVLALELRDRPEQLALVDRVQRALAHVHQIHEEVRRYAGPIVLSRSHCDLRAVWREAWERVVSVRRDTTIELREVIETDDLACSADDFAIGQVMRNIFENAIDASPDGGSVTVRADNAQMSGRPAVRISVIDEGPGVPDEAAASVFQAFYTSKPKGTGLGLAIAHRIAEAHSGQLELGSASRGACFQLTLPRR